MQHPSCFPLGQGLVQGVAVPACQHGETRASNPGSPPGVPLSGDEQQNRLKGTGCCETFGGAGAFPHKSSPCPGSGPCRTPLGSGLWQGVPVGPRSGAGSPGPPPPAGLYLQAGAAGLEGITRLSRGEVCPSSGAGTPPASPGRGEPTKPLCSCPGTNGLEAAGIGCQPATLETPWVRQREGGQVEGRRDRRTEPTQGSLALVRPIPVPAGGSHTMPAPGMAAPEMLTQPLSHSAGSQPVPPSPRSGITGHRRGWHGCRGAVAGNGELEEWILQWVLQLEEAPMGCQEKGLQDPGSPGSSPPMESQLC